MISIRRLVAWIRHFFQSLPSLERLVLSVFVIVALLSGTGVVSKYWLAGTTSVPAIGGSYTEGIVATSLADVTPTLDVLTNIGLLQYNAMGELAPAVAKAWQVSDDGKTYTFVLDDRVNRDEVKQLLEQHKDLFPDISIEVKDDRSVVFGLSQPFTPFLASITIPIFPYGPYQIAEQERGIVRLTPHPAPLTPHPHLQELVLRIYPDSFNLTQALANGEIEGVADTTVVENDRLVRNLSTYEVALLRSIYLFFNTDRERVKDVGLRQKLVRGEKVEGTPEITLVTLANPKHEALAEATVTKWTELGARVIVETHTATELATDIVPNRSYDVLIYGLDFGGDPDPYPFWHSSQIGTLGLNLSNFANIDADRLLEKARQTRDEGERKKLYEEFQKILADQVPGAELERVVARFSVDPDIKGIQSRPGVSASDRYAFIEEWYRKTERVKK